MKRQIHWMWARGRPVENNANSVEDGCKVWRDSGKMCASQQYEDHQTTTLSIEFRSIISDFLLPSCRLARGFISLQETRCISSSATDHRSSNEGHGSEVLPRAGIFLINPSPLRTRTRTRTNIVLDTWSTTTLERWGSSTDSERGFWVISSTSFWLSALEAVLCPSRRLSHRSPPADWALMRWQIVI